MPQDRPTTELGFNFRTIGNWIFICIQAISGLGLKSYSVKFELNLKKDVLVESLRALLLLNVTQSNKYEYILIT